MYAMLDTLLYLWWMETLNVEKFQNVKSKIVNRLLKGSPTEEELGPPNKVPLNLTLVTRD